MTIKHISKFTKKHKSLITFILINKKKSAFYIMVVFCMLNYYEHNYYK